VLVVNIHEAKLTLSRLVEAVETGMETEIVIARNGRAAARLVPLATQHTPVRLGLARGHFAAPDDIDATNAEVAALFAGHSA
jgi:prevent-host-death family protein